MYDRWESRVQRTLKLEALQDLDIIRTGVLNRQFLESRGISLGFGLYWVLSPSQSTLHSDVQHNKLLPGTLSHEFTDENFSMAQQASSSPVVMSRRKMAFRPPVLLTSVSAAVPTTNATITLSTKSAVTTEPPAVKTAKTRKISYWTPPEVMAFYEGVKMVCL